MDLDQLLDLADAPTLDAIEAAQDLALAAPAGHAPLLIILADE
jgi:hypothetical protein